MRNGKKKKVDVRWFKGLRKILEERGKWGCDLNGKEWKLNCGDKLPGRSSLCCARHYTANNCPDFVAQKTALQEVIEARGHIFEKYPKYHCECNWIEMYWGMAKYEARIKCDYLYKALDANLPAFLDKAGDIKKIKRWFHRSMRYIEAYSQYEDGKEVAEIIKKYVSTTWSSHRRVVLRKDELTED